MPVVIARQYQKDLQVDGSMKARAWDLVLKLSNDPDGGGLDLKMPQGVSDRRVRTARVDQNFRAVMFALPPDTLVLAAIKPHDEAYAYAAGLRLNINPANGAMELVADQSVQEDVQAVQRRPRLAEAPQVLPYDTDDLVSLGVRADAAAAAVQLSTEDELLELIENLPDWQQQALLDLATGKSLADVRADYGVGTGATEDPQESLTRAVTRMSFVTIHDEEQLRRVLEGDFETWRTFLHPQQRQLAERVYNGPFRVTGGAGTGKTLVALHRAVHLAGLSGGRVLLCTFNRTLAATLRRQLERLAPADLNARIDVLGVDQAVLRAVRLHDGGDLPKVLDARAQEALWRGAVDGVDVPHDLRALLTPDFLSAEFRSVVLALPDATQESYLWSKRPGRRVRLSSSQRSVVWAVIEAFRHRLVTQDATTFDILAARAADVASPRYDHVVVDEGQDLHAAHWRFLRRLVRPGPNDLFICEDAHQRIYGERLVLSRYGIDTRGRSRRLTLNYRSSRQNLRFALGIIRDAEVTDSEGKAESVAGYRAAFDGPHPTLCGFTSNTDEAAHVAATVKNWLAAGVAPGAVGVLVRRHADAELLSSIMRDEGVEVADFARTSETTTGVAVTTMHRAKGLEFSRVIIAAVDDTTMPSKFLLDQAPESDRQTVLTRERSLLYVAATRARDELVITWAGNPSRFLALP